MGTSFFKAGEENHALFFVLRLCRLYFPPDRPHFYGICQRVENKGRHPFKQQLIGQTVCQKYL